MARSVLILRSRIPDTTPVGLAEGQLAVEMASAKPRLWVGVPTTIDPDGRRLVADGAGPPLGGAIYEALIKLSAADGDYGWRGAGVRPANNTAIGTGALIRVTSGNNNVAVGINSLTNTLAGGNNTAVGANALLSNTAGTFNTAVGSGCLFASTGISNTAVGAGALDGNTGARNTAVGRQAGRPLSSGDDNVAVGYGALNLSMGTGNTVVGAQALEGSTPPSPGVDNNTVIGRDAMGFITTAGSNNNVAVGWNAARYRGAVGTDPINHAVNATFLGAQTRSSAVGQTNEIVIGFGALGRGSNTITLGNAAVTALHTQASIYVRDQKLGGFAPSVAWTAETDPDNVPFWINNTGRVLQVATISGIPEVPNGEAATVHVVKAASGTSLANGTLISNTAFNANGPAGITQPLVPVPGMTVAIGERLGLQAESPTGWELSIASITVYLEP